MVAKDLGRGLERGVGLCCSVSTVSVLQDRRALERLCNMVLTGTFIAIQSLSHV